MVKYSLFPVFGVAIVFSVHDLVGMHVEIFEIEKKILTPRPKFNMHDIVLLLVKFGFFLKKCPLLDKIIRKLEIYLELHSPLDFHVKANVRI